MESCVSRSFGAKNERAEMGGRLNHGLPRGISNGEDYFGGKLTLSRTMVLVRQAIARATTQPIRVPTVGGLSFAWMQARRRTPLALLPWTTAEHVDSASTHASLRRTKRKRSSGCASDPVVVLCATLVCG